MKLLSTGQPSTLGTYKSLASSFFGSTSGAVKFLEDKISNSPNGENEEVITDEGQMILALHSAHGTFKV